MEVAIIALQLLLIVVFSIAGIGKLMGLATYQKFFAKHVLRIIVGLLEVVSAICLILGFFYETFVMYGALMLVSLAIGRVRVHLRMTQAFRELLPTIFFGFIAFMLLFLVIW